MLYLNFFHHHIYIFGVSHPSSTKFAGKRKKSLEIKHVNQLRNILSGQIGYNLTYVEQWKKKNLKKMPSSDLYKIRKTVGRQQS